MTTIPTWTAEEISQALRRTATFKSTAHREHLAAQFSAEGYLKVSDAIPPNLMSDLHLETGRLILESGIRRDTTVGETSGSPRRMTNVSRESIAQSSRLIPALYANKTLTEFLGAIAEDELVACPYKDEEYIITCQQRPGDTHGWHWGDYPYTLIWIIDGPSTEHGGMLQYIPHTRWNKKDPRINEILTHGLIRTRHHDAGDVYFLRSDTTLHRTVPLSGPCRRVILNTCWASANDHRSDVDHTTMQQAFV